MTQGLPTEQTTAGKFARMLVRALGTAFSAPQGSVTAALFLAFGDSLSQARTTVSRALDQAFATTASDLLSDLEERYGLDVRTDLSDDARQARLVAKIRAARAGTEQSISTALEAVSITVTVAGTTCTQANAAGVPRKTFRFTIYITDTAYDDATTIALVSRIAQQMKPAHTLVQIATGAPFTLDHSTLGRLDRNTLA